MLKNERGIAMVLVAIVLPILILFAGLALDIGRGHLMQAELQTAMDAATLGAAQQAVTWVEVRIIRYRWTEVDDYCPNPPGPPVNCGSHLEWEDASITVQGEYDALLPHGWRSRLDCSSPYDCREARVKTCWLKMKPDVISVANETFHLNAHWPASHRVKVTRLSFELDESTTPPTVHGVARLTIPTAFLRLIRMNDLEIGKTASASPLWCKDCKCLPVRGSVLTK